MMNYTEHTELPPIESNVSVRLLEGVIVTGAVTGHGHKDGKPTFDPMRGKPCRLGQGQERGRHSRPGGLDWF